MNGTASRTPAVLDRVLDRCDPDCRWDRRLALFRSAEQGPLGIGNRRLGHHRVDCGSCDPTLACWSIILNVTVATFASRQHLDDHDTSRAITDTTHHHRTRSNHDTRTGSERGATARGITSRTGCLVRHRRLALDQRKLDGAARPTRPRSMALRHSHGRVVRAKAALDDPPLRWHG